MTAWREATSQNRTAGVDGGPAAVEVTSHGGSRHQQLPTSGQQVNVDTALSAEESLMTSCGLKQKRDPQRHNVDCGRAHMARVVTTSDGRLDGDGTPGISLEKCYSWRWTRRPAERVPVVDCWIDEVLLQRANKEIRLANKYRSSPACRQVLYEKYMERPAGGDCSWWADGLTAHGKRTLFEVQRKKAAKSQLHQHRANSTPLPSWTMSWKNMYRYANNNNKYFSSSTQPSRPSSSVSTTDKSRSRRPMSAV